MRFLLLLQLLMITVAFAAPLNRAIIPHRISANPDKLILPDKQETPLNIEVKEQFIRIEENPFVKAA